MRQLMLIIALSGLIFSSCTKDTPPPTPVSRTMLIYMSANNSLAPDATNNMAAIERAVTKGALNGGRIVVLWRQKPNSAKTQLIEVLRGSNGQAYRRILKDYGGAINSSDAAFLRQTIADMKHYAPADKYCLDLWSHAFGWIPTEDWKPANAISTFSFGDDRFGDDESHKMNINDLADAIDEDVFDFILFDCCLMGNIETLYQIRNKTPYVIASPAEIVGEGMPYDMIVPIIFKSKTPILEDICKAYYTADDKYRVISLYDMSKIEDVASAYAAIMEKYKADGKGPLEDIALSDLRANVQRFRDDAWKLWAFDMLDLSNYLSDNTAQPLKDAIASMVILKLFHTNGFTTIDPLRFCGLGMSLPLNHYDDWKLNWKPYYETLDWHTRIYNK